VLEFAKLHGLGNDFVVVKLEPEGWDDEAITRLARRICDRRRGIGADGTLLYWDTPEDTEAAVRTRIFNADGSETEMSGNGVRCLAALLVTRKAARKPLRIRTLSGVKTLRLCGEAGSAYTFESSMGKPNLDPRALPARVERSGPVLDHPLSVDGEVVAVTLSSIGNPHCSTFWPDLEDAPFERLGPRLERHPIFPNRTNVEFVQVLGRDRLRVRFWERGVGETPASGTGSCAAALAALLHDYVESPVTVQTEQGSLRVARDPGGELFLTGPAELVCTGRYRIDGDG
jgi:diaminopimelate epimerase